MLGIEAIGSYISEYRQDNMGKTHHGIEVELDFLESKVGFLSVSRKGEEENTVDLCERAFQDLINRQTGLLPEEIDCVCLCTQNGEYQIPHTSAILQDRLSLPKACAAFDVSLGCSGYVYGLGIIKSFMEMNGFSKGLLFTCDPYSKILDTEDRNTDLLFGDAATVTLISNNVKYVLGKSAFCTKGEEYDALIKRENEFLYMDGRRIYNFVLRDGMDTIQRCMTLNNIEDKDIDEYILHQASKYVLEQLGRRMRIDAKKIPFESKTYGNTVSSSIPLLLKVRLADEACSTLLLCGFGVGLSVAASVLKRV